MPELSTIAARSSTAPSPSRCCWSARGRFGLRASGGAGVRRLGSPVGERRGFSVDSSGGGPTSSSTSPARCARPGVYRLPAGARVTDAIERAGGADRRRAAGSDQPRRPPRRRPAGGRARSAGRAGATAAPAAAAEDGPISLGSATVEQLETIDGIGPVTAAEDRRVPRPARRPRLGRPARPGERDRPGDDGVAARPPAALSARCASGATVACSLVLGIAGRGRARARPPRRDPRAGRGRRSAGACPPARRSWRAASSSARTSGIDAGDGRRLPPRRARATCSPCRGQNVALLALLAMPLLAALRHAAAHAPRLGPRR